MDEQQTTEEDEPLTDLERLQAIGLSLGRTLALTVSTGVTAAVGADGPAYDRNIVLMDEAWMGLAEKLYDWGVRPDA